MRKATKSNQVTLRLTDEFLSRLRSEADDKGLPLAQLMLQLLEKGLEVQKEEITPDLANLHKRVELLEELVINQNTKDSVA
ncbi:MAG: hypothetical protein F6K21_07795 [Symploca sp. SIO2D2]|nr:hypothetical protein [Symploca sp. SIO2D2]